MAFSVVSSDRNHDKERRTKRYIGLGASGVKWVKREWERERGTEEEKEKERESEKKVE